jgi:two-component system chemotaxis response regulator CheY
VDNQLKPKSVLLIEDDAYWKKGLRKHLQQIGVLSVETHEDGDAAWETLNSHRKPRYDLIVLDWNIPKVNGLSLLNRIRKNDCYAETPVLIISGYLQDNDFRLFEEFPMTEGLPKPTSQSQISNSIESLMKESAWFKIKRAEIASIFQSIDNGNSQALFQLRQVAANAPKPNAIIIAAAKLLIYSERYIAAEELLSFFLDDTPDSLTGLNQLAKVYLHTRRYRDAGLMLEKAQKMSPNNLERLCILGDAKLHTMQIDEAQRSFETALKIDKQNITAKLGHDFAGIIAPNIPRLTDESIPKAYSSLLNARGIIAVRGGNFDDAIEQYRNAMIYTIDPLSKGRVAFNVGLAYLRWSKPEDAISWLQRSSNYSRGQFKKGALKLAELVGQRKSTDPKAKAREEIGADPAPKRTSTEATRPPPSVEQDVYFDVGSDMEIDELERLEIPTSIDMNSLLALPKKKIV